MPVIAGTIRLPSERRAAARPAMRAMVETSRVEDGCLSYSHAEDLFDPGLIHVAERWRDRGAFDRPIASGHLAAWRACWPALEIGERALTLFASDGGEPA